MLRNWLLNCINEYSCFEFDWLECLSHQIASKSLLGTPEGKKVQVKSIVCLSWQFECSLEIVYHNHIPQTGNVEQTSRRAASDLYKSNNIPAHIRVDYCVYILYFYQKNYNMWEITRRKSLMWNIMCFIITSEQKIGEGRKQSKIAFPFLYPTFPRFVAALSPSHCTGYCWQDHRKNGTYYFGVFFFKMVMMMRWCLFQKKISILFIANTSSFLFLRLFKKKLKKWK